MPLTRRQVLALGAAAPLASVGAEPGPTARRRIRLAVSTYSYWHFRTDKYPVERVIEHAAALGFDGVEILHRQMADESPSYVNGLKKAAFVNGLDLVMLSIHQDFVSPDAAQRQKEVEHTKRCIDLAGALGISCLRINSGRWKTIASFDDLMKLKGDEPPCPATRRRRPSPGASGRSRPACPPPRRPGVVLALENHWGLTTRPENLLRIYNAIRSPWLGINLDTGNFPGEPYAGLEMLAPHAVIVQAKTYHGGGEWYTLDLDYLRIASILRGAGFGGYVSLEMEGREPAATAVPKSLEVLRAAFGG